MCENHADLREQVKDHEVRIDTLERNEASMVANFKALCWKLDAMIYVLGALSLAIFSALLTYVLK